MKVDETSLYKEVHIGHKRVHKKERACLELRWVDG